MSKGLKFNSIVAVVCLATIVGAATAAEAQVTSIVSYSFNVPVARVVANPCTGGFTLLNGTASLAVTTVQQSTSGFQVKVSLGSSGSGKDALATGALLTLGAGPTYVYSSDASLIGDFPDGVPAYFEHTLTAVDFVARDTPTLSGDYYVMRTVLRLAFNNGLPAAPTLVGITTACE